MAPAVGAVTLHGFLEGIFPPDTPPSSIHLTAFPGDPHGPTASWSGFRHKPFPYALKADYNQFFCIAVLKPKPGPRDVSQVLASPIVGLDDVGTKAKPAAVRALLTDRGIAPHAIIETSAGNYQVLYKIVPPLEDTARRMSALRHQLCALGLCDLGVNDAVRYLRLPFGINGKAKHRGWRVRLVRWHPELPPYPYAAFAAALWGNAEAEAAALALEVPQLVSGRHASLSDPLVRLAAEVGLVPQLTRDGVIECDCPFAAEHTDGDPSGFAFVNWGRCKCHHGHCAERQSRDFEAELVRMYDEQIAVGLLDGSLRPSGKDGLLLDRIGEEVCADGRAFLSWAAFSLSPLPEIRK